jgi:hypothetical protein
MDYGLRTMLADVAKLTDPGRFDWDSEGYTYLSGALACHRQSVIR